MNQRRVGEDRGSKEMDGCPLTEMDPVKITGVTDWPMPSNKKEVQSFIGFVNFY
jgi:hypothetical protein